MEGIHQAAMKSQTLAANSTDIEQGGRASDIEVQNGLIHWWLRGPSSMYIFDLTYFKPDKDMDMIVRMTQVRGRAWSACFRWLRL